MKAIPFLVSIAEGVDAPATSWDSAGIIILKLVAVVFLVLLSSFFAASEFAIVKVRASPLDQGIGRARFARQVTSHLLRNLSVCHTARYHLGQLVLGWLDEPFLAQMKARAIAYAMRYYENQKREVWFWYA